jgi:hypothetical protein
MQGQAFVVYDLLGGLCTAATPHTTLPLGALVESMPGG